MLTIGRKLLQLMFLKNGAGLQEAVESRPTDAIKYAENKAPGHLAGAFNQIYAAAAYIYYKIS